MNSPPALRRVAGVSFVVVVLVLLVSNLVGIAVGTIEPRLRTGRDDWLVCGAIQEGSGQTLDFLVFRGEREREPSKLPCLRGVRVFSFAGITSQAPRTSPT